MIAMMKITITTMEHLNSITLSVRQVYLLTVILHCCSNECMDHSSYLPHSCDMLAGSV